MRKSSATKVAADVVRKRMGLNSDDGSEVAMLSADIMQRLDECKSGLFAFC